MCPRAGSEITIAMFERITAALTLDGASIVVELICILLGMSLGRPSEAVEDGRGSVGGMPDRVVMSVYVKEPRWLPV